MRAFIAIELLSETQGEVNKLQKLIEKQNLFSAKYVEPKNIHLTLKFLDEISEEQATKISEILKLICKNSKAINISFSGLGSFPSQSRVNVLWIGLKDGDSEIKSLRMQIDNELSKIGFAKDKDYTNHITLARVKAVYDKAKLKDLFKRFEKINIAGFKANKIKLIKSTPTSEGHIYETISEFGLS